MVLVCPLSPHTTLAPEQGQNETDEKGTVASKKVNTSPSPALDQALSLPSWISPSFSLYHQKLVDFLSARPKAEDRLVLPLYDINRYTTHLFSDEPTTWPATECVDGKQQGGGLKRLNIFVTNGSTRDSGASIASRHGPPILSSSPPVRLHVGHKYSTPDTPWSKLAFVADSEAVAEKALTIRHDQSFVDGNHRTATLTLFEYLWQAGYDTRDLDPLDVFLLIAPEPEKPNAAVEIGRLVRRHTRRGTMTLEAQRIGADRVKSLPIIVSALFVLAGWVGPTPLSVWGSVVLDETLTVKRKIQSPVVGAFERHQRRIKLLETSAQKEEMKFLYALSRKLSHRKE